MPLIRIIYDITDVLKYNENNNKLYMIKDIKRTFLMNWDFLCEVGFIIL